MLQHDHTLPERGPTVRAEVLAERYERFHDTADTCKHGGATALLIADDESGRGTLARPGLFEDKFRRIHGGRVDVLSLLGEPKNRRDVRAFDPETVPGRDGQSRDHRSQATVGELGGLALVSRHKLKAASKNGQSVLYNEQ